MTNSSASSTSPRPNSGAVVAPQGLLGREGEIFRGIADGILVVSNAGEVEYVNQVMCDLLLSEPSTVLGTPLGELLAETELLALLGLEDALENGRPQWLQVVFKRHTGQYLPLSVTLSALGADPEHPAGYLMLCRDQSELRELLSDTSRMVAEEVEQRLQVERAKDEAERRERHQIEVGQAQKLESIGQLAAGIAHEINTPIQFIGDNVAFLRRAFSSLLPLVDHVRGMRNLKGEALQTQADQLAPLLRRAKVDFLSEEIPKAITQTIDGIARVSKIVRAMKEVSHPSNGERQAVDVNTLIRNTLVVARHEYKYVAEVQTNLSDHLPHPLAYPDELSQSLLNIIVNAAHAITDRVGNDGRGTITIDTLTDEDSVVIRIADDGGGIPEAVLPKIFDPFFTTKEVGRGTGQGLAIAYHAVVKKHGGRIDVQSEQGRGTTFTLHIPMEPGGSPE